MSENRTDHTSSPFADLGVVAIGRNEGERLARCLDSLPPNIRQIVYVDSGSQDKSVELARTRGVEVVELDLKTPFTAARARNAGWRRLVALLPNLSMVLFLDGDCELVAGFLEAASGVMKEAPDVVAVCGWRRERHPERSFYNTVCDVEWRSGPTGGVRAFGGDVLVSLAALQRVGGYDDSVIAAEDDEIGVRLRRNCGRIIRIDLTSTIHDAAMTRFAQWWKRAKRCGHAYGQVSDLHGSPPDRYFVTEARRSCIWGMVVPALAMGFALPTFGFSLGLLGAYPFMACRTFQGTRRRGFTARESALWAASCTAAKVPEAVGLLKYRLDKLRHRRPSIIEYKKAGS